MWEGLLAEAERLLVLVVLLVLSGLASGSETAFTTLSEHRRRSLAETGGRRGRLVADLPGTIATILLVNNLLNLTVAALVTLMLVGALGLFGGGQQWAVLLTVVVATPLLLVFGEITPKALARRHPLQFISLVAGPLSVLRLVVAPIVAPLRLLGEVDGVLERREPEAVLALSELAVEEGAIRGGEHVGIQNILRARSQPVSTVMHTWSQVERLPAGVSPTGAVDRLVDLRHSRAPVVDHGGAVLGVVHIKDLTEAETLTGSLRPALWVASDRPLLGVLRLMQERRQHFAIVGDGEEEPLGFLTLTDVLERLVGDLPDDDDPDLEPEAAPVEAEGG